MRRISKMPNRIVLYKMQEVDTGNILYAGPYSKIVSTWPKGFNKHYTILEIYKYKIGDLITLDIIDKLKDIPHDNNDEIIL